jgi:RNA-directed DNA polymerase
MRYSSLLRVLASSFLAGEPVAAQVTARARRTLGRPWRWLGPLAKRYVKQFGGHARPRHSDVVRFLRQDSGLRETWQKYFHEINVKQWLNEPEKMQPVAAAKAWAVPAIESTSALAAWLNITTGELRWFADLKGLEYRNPLSKLRNYHYEVLAKQFGKIRLLEAPKPRLKELQRYILAEIVEKVPVHFAAHGFVKGRSIKTFVAPHVGQHVVLRMDLQDFFPSFAAARIQAFFRTLGYPNSVASLLAGICTNAAPRNIWKEFGHEMDLPNLSAARILYAKPHLPQGAPTSPALANLCCYRIDCRLSGLAKAVGANYTRYADDLAFSGDPKFEKGVERFSTHVAAILMEEGFHVNFRKTRVMRRSVRQHLAGLVTNQHVNVMRADFDELKAVLTNCVRTGPTSQNRETLSDFRAHLEGRVGFVESINPHRGQKLRKIFQQIRW